MPIGMVGFSVFVGGNVGSEFDNSIRCLVYSVVVSKVMAMVGGTVTAIAGNTTERTAQAKVGNQAFP